MSAAGVEWALRNPDVDGPRKLLLVGLGWIVDDQGVTFRSQQTIAARLARDERWVRKYLAELAAQGLVTRYRRHRSDGSHTTDLIVLNWPRTEPIDLAIYSGVIGAKQKGDRTPTGEDSPGQAAGPDGATGENSPGVEEPLGEVGDKSPTPPLPGKPDTKDEEDRLFAFWQTECNHPAAKFTDERRGKIRARLRQGYTAKQIAQGIRGAARAPARNDDGKAYDDLELICRNGSKLESFIGRYEHAQAAQANGGGGVPSSQSGRLRDMAARAREMGQ